MINNLINQHDKQIIPLDSKEHEKSYYSVSVNIKFISIANGTQHCQNDITWKNLGKGFHSTQQL